MSDNLVSAPSIDEAEALKFSKLAGEWWDFEGKFAILHIFNPVRLDYIKSKCSSHFGRDSSSSSCLSGLRVLDIGCGGGLLCEPLAFLGADVVGIDISKNNISAASDHAKSSNLSIDYRLCSIEDLAASKERFDIILNMEVVEHVRDVKNFLGSSCSILSSKGLMFCATLNRTLVSYLFAIVGAEYVLGLLPRGTHKWSKFISPFELRGFLESFGLSHIDLIGIGYNPFTRRFFTRKDLSVNYILTMCK